MGRILAITTVATSVLVSLALQPASAVDRSVCPPVIGEREGMLETMHGLGFNAQVARRCSVPELDIQNKLSSDMGRFKPCLQERKITGADIDAAMAAGARDGDETYTKSGNKDLICQSSRNYYAP